MDNYGQNNNKIKQGSKVSHPDMTAKTEYKDSDEFGKDVGRYIYNKWLQGGDSSRLSSKRRHVDKLRSYVAGDPTDKREILSYVIKDTDATSLNLDTTFPNVIAPQLARIQANIDTSLYKIDSKAIDVLSIEKRSKFVENLEKKYYAKDMLKNMSQVTGVDYLGTDAPETLDELELLVSLRGKEPQEIAIETMGESVLDMEGFRDGVDQLVKRDLVELSEAVLYCNSDSRGKLNIEYVDLKDFIHSESVGRYNDNRDMYYAGQAKKYTISEFAVKYNISDPEILKQIAVSVSGMFGNEDWKDTTTWNDYRNFIVEAILYDFRTNVKETYKKKKNRRGGYKLIPKESDWNLEGKESRSEVVSSSYEVWYEGCYIPQCEMVFNHKRQDNAVRYKNSLATPVGRYIYYNTNEQSTVEKMMPFARKMWRIWLKSEQVIQSIIPDGFFFDEKSMSNMENKDPNDMISDYFETGIMIGSLEGENGEQNRMPVIQLKQEVSSKLQPLNMEWNIQYQMMKDSIGMTSGLEGKTTADSLVGVQKLSILSGNAAIDYLRKANVSMFNSLANTIVLRLQDSISKKNGKMLYAKSFGEVSVEILEAMENAHQYDFSLTVKVLPDLEQKAKFAQDLVDAVTSGSISFEDKLAIEEHSDNLTLGRKYLRVKSAQHLKEASESQQATMKAQSEFQNQQAQAKLQAEAQAYQAKKMIDLEFETKLHEFALEKMRQEYILKTGSQIDVEEFKLMGQKELDVLNNNIAKVSVANQAQQTMQQPTQQPQPPSTV